MHNHNRANKFGIGLVVGAALGAVAALFMSPKSGEENREMAAKKLKKLQKWYDKSDIKEQVETIFGDVSEQGTKLYTQARKEVMSRVSKLEDNLSENEYLKIVNDVVKNVGERIKDNETLQKMKDSFMEGWNEGDMEDVKKEVKKAVKK